MRTLIHHDGALGDTLLSLPCIDAIRSDSSVLHFIGRGDIARFLKEIGLVDSASSSDRAAFASLYTSVDAPVRRCFESFDRMFVFSARPGSPIAAAAGTVISDIRIISTIPPPGSPIPVAQYRFGQLFPGTDIPERRLPPSLQETRDRVMTALGKSGWTDGRPLVVLHPGSGGSAKCWPLERYFELVDRLTGSHRVFPVLFSGPAEEGDLKKRMDRFAFGRDSVLHAAGWRLDQAAAMLSRADLYIGNDSGFTHLAAAAGAAVIALFGPTDPFLWKPNGDRVTVLSAGFPTPIGAITPAAVYEQAVLCLSSLAG